MSEERHPLSTGGLLLLLAWILGLGTLGVVQGLDTQEEVALHRIPPAPAPQVELKVSGEAIPSGEACR